VSIHLKAKRFVEKGTRGTVQPYCPVCTSDPDSQALAYLRVEGKRESLVYKSGPNDDARVVAANTYILDPCFVGELLAWIECRGDSWVIRACNVAAGDSSDVFEPASCAGRPLGLSSSDGKHAGSGVRQGTAYLVWEERVGKRTRIRLAKASGDAISEPLDITDGSFNSYDPSCAVSADGTIYVAFGAFYRGSFHVLLQKVSSDGKPLAAPVLMDDGHAPAVYPSIWPRTAGGVWVSYTNTHTNHTSAFVQHHLSRAQHSFFTTQNSGNVRAGFYDGGKFAAVCGADANRRQQMGTTAMNVPTSGMAGHSQIFEDASGRPRILLRQHVEPGEIRFDEEDELKSLLKGDEKSPANRHPSICLVTLERDTWSEPLQIIPIAHFEAPLVFATDGRKLRIAFAQDGRSTGWSKDAEWFDTESELGVGMAELDMGEGSEPKMDAYEFVVPLPGFVMEEPEVPEAQGEYIHALGQTHAHTNLSICMRINDRTGHMNYRFMQDVQHSDFGATADHVYNMWNVEMLWTRKMAEYYYFPGAFVAFPTYEWTGSIIEHDGGPFGHVNPLFLEEEGDLDFYTPVDETCPGASLKKLWNVYAGQNIVTPPHHTPHVPHHYNWDYFDADFVRVMEVFQDFRGSGEQPGAPGVANRLYEPGPHWALDGLKRGHRFGFIGGADHGGIARGGVLVKELTRTGLYEGFMARRCFATTGMTARIEFTCNGRPQGSSVETDKADFHIRARAHSPVHELQITRNGEDVERIRVDTDELQHTWQADKKEDGEFWYCRVIFENGEIAWTSPVWLD